MKKKAGINLIVIGLLASTAVVGCGSASNTGTGSSGNSGSGSSPVTLKLGMWASSPAEKQLVDEQIAAFEKANPNIKVKTQVVTGSYLQAMQPMLASHTAPDIFYVDASYAPTLESSGALMPLDSYIKKANIDTKDFAPAALKAFQWKGSTYGLPKDINTMALEYNKDLFAKAGITAPPATWDEFQKDAELLKAKHIVPLSMPIDVARYYPFVTDFGGSYYDVSANKVTFTNAANEKGLAFYMDNMKNKNIVAPKDLGGDWAGIPFSQGKVAMVAEGAWVIPFLKQSAPNLQYGIAPFPAENGKAGNMTYTVSYSMAKATKHPNAAAKLLFFMTGKEAQKMTADSGLAIPSRISQQSAFLQKKPAYKAFVDGEKEAIPYQFGTYGQNFVDAINKATEAGVLQGMAPSKVLSQAQQTLDSQANQ
ncbi:ABC transporter substrate-binding protein [Fodinisporobacter ferrooxydans]|uniref:ABC transporter substrate-binding protein n=1 Tax=Fodinisporobacter ferrooxydans TaxID=2901836 RepID=A0ABY4CSI0_9BACL|nr:ABC transporter substrate-binding protein [Alicyclobacillaceae bacterium MYW30-H2]